jgi:hypothetical protein
VIDKSVYSSVVVSELNTIKTFCNINFLTCPPEKIVEHFVGSWNCSFIDNNLKEFIFKCRNNLLRTSDRLSHIVAGVDQNCFFCACLNNGMRHRETFNHLFRSCPVVSNLILKVIRRLGLSWPEGDLCFDQLYWFGNLNGNLEKNVLLTFDILRYHIWCSKLQRVFVTDETLTERVCNTLSTIFALKPLIKSAFRQNNNLANILQATG